MNAKKLFIGFVTLIVFIVLYSAIFYWGKPMTEASSKDVAAVTAVLQDSDSLTIDSVRFSPLEVINDSVGNYFDVQTVKYNTISDSDTTAHVAAVYVARKWWKYQPTGKVKILK